MLGLGLGPRKKPGAAAAVTPVFDVIAGGTAGWSLRKLRAAYAGSAIRVRRSSDNAEQDIGFTGNDLNTTALLSFVGANNGFVVTVYDQVGTNHITNAAAAAQPRIVAAGALITRNGKVAAQFDGVDDALYNTAWLANSDNVTLGFVGTTTFGRGADGAGAGWSIAVSPAQPNYAVVFVGNGAAGYTAPAGTSSEQVVFRVDNSIPAEIISFSNGVNNGPQAIAVNNVFRSSTIGAVAGLDTNVSLFKAGFFQEAAAWGGLVLSDGNCTTVMSNQRSYWSVP